MKFTFWQRQNYGDRKEISGCQGLEVKEEIDNRGSAWRNFFGVMEIFFILTVVVLTGLYVKIHRTEHKTGGFYYV